MRENLLVTGGCGFIGSNLVPFLVNKSYNVRILDNMSRGIAENITAPGINISVSLNEILKMSWGWFEKQWKP